MAAKLQLRDTYEAVIKSTLEKVDRAGILHEAGEARSDLLDELEKRWRAALQVVLSTAGGLRQEPVGPEQAIRKGQRVPPPHRPMQGVSFADTSWKPPEALPEQALPSQLRLPGGFRASHVEGPVLPGLQVALDPPGGGGGVSMQAGLPLPKRPRRAAAPATAADALVLAPPLKVLGDRRPGAGTSAAGGLGLATLAPGSPEDLDAEYEGCFEGAEEIISISGFPWALELDEEERPALQDEGCPPAEQLAEPVAGELSSEGSELGSDLDDSDFDEPQTDNRLFGEISKVTRRGRTWHVEMQHCILQVGKEEFLFAAATGEFAPDDVMSAEQAMAQATSLSG